MQKDTLIPKATPSGLFYSMGTLALVIVGVVYFESLFKPIIIAFLLWFIVLQFRILLGKISVKGKRLPTLARNVLAYLAIFLIAYLCVELLIVNIEGIASSMPEYFARLDTTFSDISAFINDPKYAEYLQKWLSNLNLPGMATSAVNSFSSIVASSAVVIVYVIFFILEETTHRLKIDMLFPEKGFQYERFLENMENIGKAIRSYIWSMTLISLLTGGLSYIILLIMGVDYAFLWSFLIFILNFVPYIGPLISSLLPAVFAVIIKGDLMQFVYVFIAMEGVQVILGNFIQPKLMGKGTNLSAVTVLVALAFWGMVWGIVGMILAVPIMAVVVIIFSQVPSTRYLAIILSEKGEIGQIEK